MPVQTKAKRERIQIQKIQGPQKANLDFLAGNFVPSFVLLVPLTHRSEIGLWFVLLVPCAPQVRVGAITCDPGAFNPQIWEICAIIFHPGAPWSLSLTNHGKVMKYSHFALPQQHLLLILIIPHSQHLPLLLFPGIILPGAQNSSHTPPDPAQFNREQWTPSSPGLFFISISFFFVIRPCLWCFKAWAHLPHPGLKKTNPTPRLSLCWTVHWRNTRITQGPAERDLQWPEPSQTLPRWLKIHFGQVTLVKQRGGSSLCSGMWIFCTLSALEFWICQEYFHTDVSYFLGEGAHLALNLHLFYNIAGKNRLILKNSLHLRVYFCCIMNSLICGGLRGCKNPPS